MTAPVDVHEQPLERLVYTAREAAQILGCSEQHIGALIRRGHLHTVPNMGRKHLIPKWVIEELVAKPGQS